MMNRVPFETGMFLNSLIQGHPKSMITANSLRPPLFHL